MSSRPSEFVLGSGPDSGTDRGRWVAAIPCVRGDRRPSRIFASPQSSLQVSTLATDDLLLFDGVLYNRADLVAELGRSTSQLSLADLLLLAFERWGTGLTHQIKGLFALVVIDADGQHAIAVRDPLGAYPLFYAEVPGELLLSTSIDALRQHPSVPGDLNRAALADHLSRRWPDPQETYFSAIRRVPPGHLLSLTGGRITVTRYWDPAPEDRPVDWLTEDDLTKFDVVLDQAVERAAGQGRSGIFLSGGLDSISVAAVAIDLARRSDRPSPIALSLGFPGDCSEETEQRGVAAALGLEHEFVPFEEATDPSELLSLALDITRLQPAPILNTWMPAYTELSLRGRRRGVQVILSGAGGDEWLSITPYLAADLIRSRDVRRLGMLMAGWKRSYNLNAVRVARVLLWTYGLKPLGSSLLEQLIPNRWQASRVGRTVRSRPAWVAADPALRRELADRVARWMPPATPRNGHYLNDVRLSLDHPLTSMELEEIFEMGRRVDVRYLHPYWDADVVDMLYRTPPQLLFTGGRAKSLVRGAMARRFPGLGLDRQKKRAATMFYRSVLMRDMPILWRRHGELTGLLDLGIVDRKTATEMFESSTSSTFRQTLRSVWDLINLDTWVRAHQ